ncbi:Os03g0761700, partial [Oryza sativa Japonica Group]
VLLRGEAALPLPLAWRGRPVSTAARDDELAGKSAYEVLGVGETSSSAEIKASFHRLAKETHPDVAAAAGSSRFLQILAAYEILSDSQRRAHYDIYLRSQKRVLQKHPRPSHHVYPNPSGSGIVVTRESNVVEWLKWYRLTIDDIVTKKRVATGSGYFDKLESELYTAIHAAYYGPDVRSVDLLPDCFEAEERVQQLPDAFQEKQTLPGFKTYGISQHVSTNLEKGTVHASPVYIHKREIDKNDGPHSDAYKDIELWICGKLVATATRSPKCNCIDKSDVEDHIHVFLVPNEVASSDFTQELPILGTITGLATTGEEGSCCVYDSRGIKTHLIVKHRTLMVKHMHWYQVGDEISPCECRCSRARLPPSRYWLFEPRCYMHDTGGWYIETFGRDKKGRKILSPRQWDGSNEHSERRLHPAMYLAALAYRSLDIEDAQRKKWSITTFLELQSSHICQLCKKIFNGGKESS